MPLYICEDRDGNRSEVLLEPGEFLALPRNDEGDKVYKDSVVLITSRSSLHAEQDIPAATRKFGDAKSTPAFGRKVWQ